MMALTTLLALLAPQLFVWWLCWRNQSSCRHLRVCQPAKLRPELRSQRKPDWVVNAVLRLAALYPQRGHCRAVAFAFNRLHAGRASVSKSFVAYTVRTHRHRVEQMRREFKRRAPRAVAINRTWALDMTGKADARGAVHMVLGVLDHGSRRLLVLQRLSNKNAWTLLGHLFLAVGRFGRPTSVRTDNEACLTSRVFSAGLRWADISHQRTVPGCPWMNGRIERLFGTFKERINTLTPLDGNGFDLMLTTFARWYNEVRPHQNLGGATPMEAWTAIDPYAKPPKRVAWFEDWEGRLVGFHMRR